MLVLTGCWRAWMRLSLGRAQGTRSVRAIGAGSHARWMGSTPATLRYLAEGLAANGCAGGQSSAYRTRCEELPGWGEGGMALATTVWKSLSGSIVQMGCWSHRNRHRS